jgi:hypothetical protein
MKIHSPWAFKPLSHKDRHTITLMFTCDRIPVKEIASIYNRSTQRIYQILKLMGVDAHTIHNVQASSCPLCGKPIKRSTDAFTNAASAFCSEYCYNWWVYLAREYLRLRAYCENLLG